MAERDRDAWKRMKRRIELEFVSDEEKEEIDFGNGNRNNARPSWKNIKETCAD